MKVLISCGNIQIWKDGGQLMTPQSEKKLKENIQKNLIYYRKMQKVTQKQLAEAIDTATTTISGWERGVATPDIDTLFLICNFFKVSLNDICGVFNDNTAMNESENRLLNAFRSLNEHGQTELMKRADELRNLGYIKGEITKMA